MRTSMSCNAVNSACWDAMADRSPSLDRTVEARYRPLQFFGAAMNTTRRTRRLCVNTIDKSDGRNLVEPEEGTTSES